MLNLISTNLVAILASTLSAIVVAGIWYSPAVFGNLWQKEAGIKKKDIRASFARKSVIALVMIFVTAVVLQRFLIITNPSSVFEAIKVAVWIWPDRSIIISLAETFSNTPPAITYVATIGGSIYLPHHSSSR